MCYDMSSYYDYCPYGCCDEQKDTICCKYFGPFLGISVALAIFVSVLIITILCCKRQKGSPGEIISQGDINTSMIIETCTMKECSTKVNVSKDTSVVPALPPCYASINHGYKGSINGEDLCGIKYNSHQDYPPPYQPSENI